MKRVHESRPDETDVSGAGAPESEIEITPAMVRAGVAAWFRLDEMFYSSDERMMEVIKAVEKAKQHIPHGQIHRP